ncbi:MAG: alpha/beta fold hydrolase [Alphaproteobacteria bacterium]
MKIALRNRYGKTFFAHLFLTENAERIVFVQHGYSGSVDSDHIKPIIATYRNNGYTVIAFDFTNSFNEADGTLAESTIETHLHDLEDGIAWASSQSWYREPFALAGHSLGGFSALLYAENNPNKVLHLFPSAALINGPAREESYARFAPEELAALQAGQSVLQQSVKDGVTYEGSRAPEYFHSLFRYDALPQAGKLHMPVMLMVGEKDTVCLPKHQWQLFQALSGPKDLHIISDAEHCFDSKLPEMAAHLDVWLKSLNR